MSWKTWVYSFIMVEFFFRGIEARYELKAAPADSPSWWFGTLLLVIVLCWIVEQRKESK